MNCVGLCLPHVILSNIVPQIDKRFVMRYSWRPCLHRSIHIDQWSADNIEHGQRTMKYWNNSPL